MNPSAPPRIFSSARRIAVRRRMAKLQRAPGAPRYLIDDMLEDAGERISFLRFGFRRALLATPCASSIADTIQQSGEPGCTINMPGETFDEEQPFGSEHYDLILSLGSLDTVNDLPGALIHMRNALAPGGLMIASFLGANSLPMLRQAMLAADAARPAPRIHPQVDVRAGGQLMQRAGFADPVVDTRSLDVGFGSFDSLIADLRAQGLTNVLADPGPPLGKAAINRARGAFAAEGRNGRIVERFEILTLSGWKR